MMILIMVILIANEIEINMLTIILCKKKQWEANQRKIIISKPKPNPPHRYSIHHLKIQYQKSLFKLKLIINKYLYNRKTNKSLKTLMKNLKTQKQRLVTSEQLLHPPQLLIWFSHNRLNKQLVLWLTLNQ